MKTKLVQVGDMSYKTYSDEYRKQNKQDYKQLITNHALKHFKNKNQYSKLKGDIIEVYTQNKIKKNRKKFRNQTIDNLKLVESIDFLKATKAELKLFQINNCIEKGKQNKRIGAVICPNCHNHTYVSLGCGSYFCPDCHKKRVSTIRKNMYNKIPTHKKQRAIDKKNNNLQKYYAYQYQFISIRPHESIYKHITAKDFRATLIKSFKHYFPRNKKQLTYGGFFVTEYFPEKSKFGVHFHGIIYFTQFTIFNYSKWFKVFQVLLRRKKELYLRNISK